MDEKALKEMKQTRSQSKKLGGSTTNRRGAPEAVTTAQVFQKKSLPHLLAVSTSTFSPRVIDHSSIYDCFKLQAHCGWALSSIKHFWCSKDTELFLHTSLLCIAVG